MEHPFFSRVRRQLAWLAAALLWTAPAAFAQAQQEAEADPPGRVAHLTHREGGVVFAPEGEEEWVDVPRNRPITIGDRLWSDKGARAELHLGSATLHLDGESHLGVSALDAGAAQFILLQGTVNARVRDLAAGENFEIDTPNLALRAQQPGDYRVDVNADGSQTRVIVHSGTAVVYGEGGQSLNLGAGQQATFAGRFLAQVQQPAWQPDAFGQWAAERNRAEDASVAARHVPRGVVGYPQLDAHGTWETDATHGEVWYPQVTVQDWAPYRYGRWEHIAPWGWTWIDDAPWGFAPFHYGRWAQIGPRWGWVPGRIAPRPLYAPALVAFFGGSGGGLTISTGPGVGWYPLGPGEAWWPTYRYSPRYVAWANPHIDLHRYHRGYHGHMHRQRPHAVTAVREDDFRHGRVRGHWRSVGPSAMGQVHLGALPQPDRRGRGDRYAGAAPRLQAPPPRPTVAMAPSRAWGPREGWSQRERPQVADRNERVERGDRNDRNDRYEGRRGWQQQAPSQYVRPAPSAPAPQIQQPRGPWDGNPAPRQPGAWARGDGGRPDNAVREQYRAQREQYRLQGEAEREARQQMRQQHRQQPQPVPGFGPPRMHMTPPQPAAPISTGRQFDQRQVHRGDGGPRFQQRAEQGPGRGGAERHGRGGGEGRGGWQRGGAGHGGDEGRGRGRGG
jgi:hypothetical protein